MHFPFFKDEQRICIFVIVKMISLLKTSFSLAKPTDGTTEMAPAHFLRALISVQKQLVSSYMASFAKMRGNTVGFSFVITCCFHDIAAHTRLKARL